MCAKAEAAPAECYSHCSSPAVGFTCGGAANGGAGGCECGVSGGKYVHQQNGTCVGCESTSHEVCRTGYVYSGAVNAYDFWDVNWNAVAMPAGATPHSMGLSYGAVYYTWQPGVWWAVEYGSQPLGYETKAASSCYAHCNRHGYTCSDTGGVTVWGVAGCACGSGRAVDTTSGLCTVPGAGCDYNNYEKCALGASVPSDCRAACAAERGFICGAS